VKASVLKHASQCLILAPLVHREVCLNDFSQIDFVMVFHFATLNIKVLRIISFMKLININKCRKMMAHTTKKYVIAQQSRDDYPTENRKRR
jgi:hypothetical protein